MIYQNFEVTPVGNARILPAKDALIVDFIGNSGLDGILVKTDRPVNYKIFIDRQSYDITQPNSFIKYATILKNRLGQPITTNERFERYDATKNVVRLGYNYHLLPERFNLVGYLAGNTVFEFEIAKIGPIHRSDDTVIIPNPLQPISEQEQLRRFNWRFWKEILEAVVAVIELGVLIYQAIPEATEETLPHFILNEQGKCIRREWLTTTDPNPFEVDTPKGTFTVDQVGIKTIENFFPPYIQMEDVANSMRGYATMITAAGIGSFKINSIEDIIDAQ